MSVPARHGLTIWWMRRFPPLSRAGWKIATFGSTRGTARTVFGIGLMGAGVVLRRNRRRKVLYRGFIEPGSGTHIRVLKGDRAIYDRMLES